MLTIVLITTLLTILFANQFRRRCKLPPGPYPLPLIGNLHQILWKVAKHGGIVEAMKQWKKEYGPVFTLWMGPQPTVHVCSMELAQETMLKRGVEFSDRWAPMLFTLPRDGLGIMGTSGELWTEQRRFALHTLRNFGLGRSLMEDRIIEEFTMRADKFDANNNGNVVEMDPKPFLDLMVGSIINRMLFNESHDEENGAEFYHCKKELDAFFERLSIVIFFVQEKLFFDLPIIRDRLRKLVDPINEVRVFLRKQVQNRLNDIETGRHLITDEPEDYVDTFILKMKEESENETTTYAEETLVVNLMDLWIAGQETTVTTIIAGFGHLLNNLEVIDKVREELLSVTKGLRHLSLKDKPNTPYYNSAIIEIQRHASVVNTNLFRRVREDTLVGGHPVSEGTPITAQISVLMSDEQYFPDAEKFDPSRFLKGDKLDQHVVAFGMGKRACPAESLARAELYLIMGNMILRYHMEPSDVLPVMEQKNNVGVMKRPQNYTMRIKKIA